MKAFCPTCKDYRLSYKDKLKLSPSYGTVRAMICPKCGSVVCSTSLSRSLFILFILVPILAYGFIHGPSDLPKHIVIGLITLHLLIDYLVFWPLTMQVKKWKPLKSYLPKSRIVGYTLYLFIPIILIVSRS